MINEKTTKSVGSVKKYPDRLSRFLNALFILSLPNLV
jgi:hypothetical protein